MNSGPAQQPRVTLQPGYTRTRRVEGTEDIDWAEDDRPTYRAELKSYKSKGGISRDMTRLLISVFPYVNLNKNDRRRELLRPNFP